MRIDTSKKQPSFAKSVTSNGLFICLVVLVALLSCIIWGCLAFGYKTIIYAAVTVGIASLAELIYCLLRKVGFDYTVCISALILSMTVSVEGGLIIACLSGLILGCLFVIHHFVFRYFSFQPTVIAILLVSLLLFHTYTPFDTVIEGVKPSSVTVAQLIGGIQKGGWGSVSFIAILLGYFVLSVTKRIKPAVPLLFCVALVLGICMFYESTDLVTQLYYISYALFDGKIAFLAVFILTMPSVLPRFGSSAVIASMLLGVITAFVVVTFKNADLSYAVLAASSVLSGIITRLRYRIKARKKKN